MRLFKTNLTKDQYQQSLFRLKKENEAIKDRIIGDIKNLLEQEGGNYYTPVKVVAFQSKNYIKSESNSDCNKNL